MKIIIFCHSILSDWNHGNAHFLRGIATELICRGHQVRFYEDHNAWSLTNLVSEYGDSPISELLADYPNLDVVRYHKHLLDLDEMLDAADLVLVHEWSPHDLVRKIGEHRNRSRSYRLLFHDTHHRSITDPAAMAAYDLSHYDGVLAFGEAIRSVYLKEGWTDRVWTWHEAADLRVFRPIFVPVKDSGIVWIGNWGDEERTEEIREYLIHPIRDLQIRAKVFGVRYPDYARAVLAEVNMEYGGWLPNYRVPQTLGQYKATVHIPRRPYAEALTGIPTIRVFEALACGIPLISAFWEDSEGLFKPDDFLMARSGSEMKKCLRAVLNDRDLAESIISSGLNTILARHTCSHRVDELLRIYTAMEGAQECSVSNKNIVFSEGGKCRMV